MSTISVELTAGELFFIVAALNTEADSANDQGMVNVYRGLSQRLSKQMQAALGAEPS